MNTVTLHGHGGEATAADVHTTLCDVVTTQAAKFSVWADYAAVLVDPEVAAFFAARLPREVLDEPSQPKKRKLRTDSAAAEGVTAPAKVCERCGGAVPEVSLRVACLDGSALDLTVPKRELVREVKRAVGQVKRAPGVSGQTIVANYVVPPDMCPLTAGSLVRMSVF
jgi:hypothetical protein